MVTYYISPSGNDTEGDGSLGSPWQTLSKFNSTAAVGDTCILRDGTYTAALSLKNHASTWTRYEAENDGAAVITGGVNLTSNTNYHCIVQGIRFNDSGEKYTLGSYLKWLRCSFQGGPGSGNVAKVTIGSNNFTPAANYQLFEDCFCYGGGGRYQVLVYNATNIVLRRVVVRTDQGWTASDGAPAADICVYDSQNIAVFDCISVDGYGVPGYVASFYNACNGTTSTPNSTREFKGIIAVNSPNYLMGTEGQDTVTGMTVYDVASYGGEFGISQLKGTSVGYRRLAFAVPAVDGFYFGASSATIHDSVCADAGNTAWDEISPTTSVSYASVAAAKTAGWWYLPRIEAGSTLASGGTYGQRGANILTKIGTSGTLYGDTGYNTDTGASLWPWPYEDRIKAEMAAVSTRGFCAAGNALDGNPLTLTRYIWEILGNAMPSGIYEAAPTGKITLSVR